MGGTREGMKKLQGGDRGVGVRKGERERRDCVGK